MAARNVVLAEQMGVDITLICNGCYKSIYEVNEKLKHNDELRDGVNEVLKEIDMELRNHRRLAPRRFLLRSEDSGLKKIVDSVTRPVR